MTLRERMEGFPVQRARRVLCWFFLLSALAIIALRFYLGLPIPLSSALAAVGLPLAVLVLDALFTVTELQDRDTSPRRRR